MTDKEKKHCCGCNHEKEIKKDKAIDSYPGASLDVADGEKVSSKLEKERTKVLGDNPNGEL